MSPEHAQALNFAGAALSKSQDEVDLLHKLLEEERSKSKLALAAQSTEQPGPAAAGFYTPEKPGALYRTSSPPVQRNGWALLGVWLALTLAIGIALGSSTR